MITKETIKKYFTTGIIIILLLLLIFSPHGVIDRIKGNGNSEIEIKIDTVWTEVHDTIAKNVPIISYKYVAVAGPQFTSGENIDTCKARFQYLLKQHIKQTAYEDTIHLDSLGLKGTITIKDTIWLNKFKGKRQYLSNLKIPTIEKTITITKEADPVRQIYIGGNLFGDQNQIQVLTPGILYKTKKDNIYQINAGVTFTGDIIYGVGMYYKISLRKKE